MVYCIFWYMTKSSVLLESDGVYTKREGLSCSTQSPVRSLVAE